jgi:drug/metabolite transporter (DMT)-like permease
VAVGIAALSIDFKQVGTGIVLLLVGVGIALYGARWNRRFTTWIWAVGAALGGILIVAKIVGSSSTGAAVGIALIILGVLFVVGGALLARAINEPDDAPAEPA